MFIFVGMLAKVPDGSADDDESLVASFADYTMKLLQHFQ